MEPTLDNLRKLGATLRKNAVRPKTARDSEEADRMTANDPSGHVWHVGDEYYEFQYFDGASLSLPLERL
jgi:hypothetical protein